MKTDLLRKSFLLIIPIIYNYSTTFCQQNVNEDELIQLSYNSINLEVDLAVGLWAIPLPLDYDNDGDMDLIISCTDVPFKGTYFFENTSGIMTSETVFAPPVKIGVGMNNVTISYINGKPRVLGPGIEFHDFVKNGYNRPTGIFNANEVLSLHPRKRFCEWKYVDYENDGDLDLIVGVDDWSDYGWDNAFNSQGEWTRGDLHGYVYLITNNEGSYSLKGKIEAGGKPIDVEGNTTPNIGDFDGDGDLDIICGEFVDCFTWFENIGTRENPEYTKGVFLENRNGIIKMDLEMMKPVAVDWNQDGKLDLIVGDEDGRIAYIENQGKDFNGMPLFKSPSYFKQKADFVKFGALVMPYSVDWDEDGDEDLICGNSAGYICFFENLDGGESPKWDKPKFLKADGETIRILAGHNGSIQGPIERKWGYTVLSVADWDGDGLKDIIINSIWGKIEWYKNTGRQGFPELSFMGGITIDWKRETPAKPKWNWWEPEKDKLCTQWRTTPYAIDWNKDGLMDLVMLDHEGYLAYFERFKKADKLYLHPGKRIFNEINDKNEKSLLRLNSKEAGGSGRRKICFADWDSDGDLDLLANSKNIEWFENVGESNGMVSYKKRGDLVKRQLAGHTTSPTTVDWDKNGVPDLLIGAEDGHLYYFKNK